MDKYELAENIKDAIPNDINDLDVIRALIYLLDDYTLSMEFDRDNNG